MATRQRAPISPENPAAPGGADWQMPVATPGNVLMDPAEREEIEEESVTDRLRALLSTSGADSVKLKLYRRDPKKSGMEWCADYTPDEFIAGDLEMVRNEWGAGAYELRIINSGGVAGRQRIDIATPRNAPQVAAVSPVNSELTSILQQMAQQNAAILQALNTRPDASAEMAKILALMGAMREAMGLNVAPAAPAPAASPSSMLAEIVGAVKMLRDVSADINPPQREPGLMDMLPDVLGMVKQGMSNQASAAPQQLAPLQLPATLSQMETAPQVAAEQPQGEEMGMLVMRGMLQKLIEMAKAEAPADEGGQYIYENVPDEIIPYLNLPNWFQILCSFESSLKPYELWARSAHAEALKLFAEDDAEDAAPAESPTPGK